MRNDNFARQAASKLLRRYYLSDLSLDNIIYIINDYGYDIVEYTDNGSESKQLLQSLELLEFAKMNKAFTYSDTSTKIIFIREELNAKEKLYVLAHELGHIVCKHTDKKASFSGNVEDEREANEFAHYIMHPNLITRMVSAVYMHKTLSVISLIAVLLAAVTGFTLYSIKKEDAYYGNYYITESGTKYHTEECIYVKNKNNIKRLTVDEFEANEYGPCKVCLPEQ